MDELDETTGLLYAGRRVFLHTEGSDNKLEPPPEFMTRKQMRNYTRVRRGAGLEGLKTLDLFKEGEHSEAIKKEKAKKQSEGRKKREKEGIYEITRFSSTQREDWEMIFQAGCRMWVRKLTGEVVDECPWLDEGEDDDDAGTLLTDAISATDATEQSYATGAGVYDPREVEELFEQLDACAGQATARSLT